MDVKISKGTEPKTGFPGGVLRGDEVQMAGVWIFSGISHLVWIVPVECQPVFCSPQQALGK